MNEHQGRSLAVFQGRTPGLAERDVGGRMGWRSAILALTLLLPTALPMTCMQAFVPHPGLAAVALVRSGSSTRDQGTTSSSVAPYPWTM